MRKAFDARFIGGSVSLVHSNLFSREIFKYYIRLDIDFNLKITLGPAPRRLLPSPLILNRSSFRLNQIFFNYSD